MLTHLNLNHNFLSRSPSFFSSDLEIPLNVKKKVKVARSDYCEMDLIFPISQDVM